MFLLSHKIYKKYVKYNLKTVNDLQFWLYDSIVKYKYIIIKYIFKL